MKPLPWAIFVVMSCSVIRLPVSFSFAGAI